MHRNIDDVEFSVFDTETTGLEPQSGDRIIEIAAVRLKGQEKIAQFQTLVNPHRQVSEAAFKVNRITPAMLENAPDIATVMPKFLSFIKDTCLCSYNAAFDLEFLNNELRLMGSGNLEGVVVVDLLGMARRLIPGLERYSLSFVSEKLGIKFTQEHRALSDVELTLRLFAKLKETLKAKGVQDFMNFAGLFGISSHFLDDVINQRVSQIQQAIALGVKLQIKYLSSFNAQVTERQVMPKEIRQDRGRTYLVGYCFLRNDERSFRVDSILHLEIV
jgi:DNA polymerase III epsilon subunit family exonuclease